MNKITAYKIYSASVILRGVKRLEGEDKDALVLLLYDIAAQEAEREQSPAVVTDAVGVVIRNPSGQMYVQWFDKKTVADFVGRLIYTRPTPENPMSEQMTLEQLSVKLRNEADFSEQCAARSACLDAHLAQHAAMVARLRELSKWCHDDLCGDVAYKIDAILSADSSEPVE